MLRIPRAADVKISKKQQVIQLMSEIVHYDDCLPRWAFTKGEWGARLLAKAHLENRLRKLRQELSVT